MINKPNINIYMNEFPTKYYVNWIGVHEARTNILLFSSLLEERFVEKASNDVCQGYNTNWLLFLVHYPNSMDVSVDYVLHNFPKSR